MMVVTKCYFSYHFHVESGHNKGDARQKNLWIEIKKHKNK